jgi:hypothetical protein
VAKGQKQMEQMATWISLGLTGVDDLNAMFQRFYGLDGLSKNSERYSASWNEAVESFLQSLKAYLELFNMMPRDDYLRLLKENDDLKRELAEHEKTIQHLETLMAAKLADPTEIARSLQDLIKRQSEQFQELVKGFSIPGQRSPARRKR